MIYFSYEILFVTLLFLKTATIKMLKKFQYKDELKQNLRQFGT